MIPISLDPLIAEARQDLDTLRAAGDDPDPALAYLLDDLYRIGLAIEREPSHRVSPDLRRFIDDSAAVFYDRSTALLFQPNLIVQRFRDTWIDDEWRQLCAARSGLQFLIDLYPNTLIDDFLPLLEADYVDDFIRRQGHEGHLYDNEIPRSIPQSHWWWWYPEPPRPGASG